MYIVFGFGKNPSADDLKYVVTSYDFSVDTLTADTSPANCLPGEITLQLELPPEANPASEFLSFATQQHATAATDGAGKIAVYPGENVGQSLQEISFRKGWISHLDVSTSVGDDKFHVTMRVSAAEVTVSGIDFQHPSRLAHFAKRRAA